MEVLVDGHDQRLAGPGQAQEHTPAVGRSLVRG